MKSLIAIMVCTVCGYLLAEPIVKTFGQVFATLEQVLAVTK